MKSFTVTLVHTVNNSEASCQVQAENSEQAKRIAREQNPMYFPICATENAPASRW